MDGFASHQLVAQSAEVRALLERIPLVARARRTTLISGPTGSGKLLRFLECGEFRSVGSAWLDETTATDACFDRADLSTASLTELDATGASFMNAVAPSARFERAILEGACFREANLQGATFEGANLRGADFRGADLRRAWLANADLRGALFDGAELQDAELEGAQWSDPTELQQRVDAAWGDAERALDDLAARIDGPPKPRV